MNRIRSRLKPGLRSNEPAEPCPGPPAIRNITPRAVPWAGKTSTCRATVPDVPPVRSSGATTVPHWTPPVLHGVRLIAARAWPAAAKKAEARRTRKRRRPTKDARVAVPVYPFGARYPLRNWSDKVFDSVTVIGSGATTLDALEPHQRRLSVHPLQTFTRARGPEQLDGAWAAVTAESDDARAVGFWLAETLGLRPFELDDTARPLYHAGAAIASNYLVTLHEVAADLFRAAGAPPEALVPLMRRTIENGFELTGPIERGDWETVEAHRRAIRAARPDLEPLYDVLAEATAR